MMKSVRRTITPKEAAKLLENTTFQRPLNTVFAGKIVEDIKAGKFVCNGETIVIDSRGRVLDGQHRLWACFMADEPIESWVIEGADESMFGTYDTGRSRSVYDVVSITQRGRDDLRPTARRVIAASAAILMGFDNEGRYVDAWHGARRPRSEVAAFIEKNPKAVERGKAIAEMGVWPFPASIVAAVYTLTADGYPDGLDGFFRPLQSGAGLSPGSVILKLRAIFMGSKASRRTSREILALCIKAWNFYVAGATPGQLQYQAGVEAYPSLRLRPDHNPEKVKRAGALTGAAATKRSLAVMRNGKLTTA